MVRCSEEGLKASIEEEKLRIWWSNDSRGSRKRSLDDKRKILQEVKQTQGYDGSGDLKLEDIEISVSDALEFFGFDSNIKIKDLKKVFKDRFREFQLKYHPMPLPETQIYSCIYKIVEKC